MTTQQPVPIDLDDVLTQIRDSLLQYPARHGAVKLVIESEAGEEIHVLKIDSLSRASLRTAPTLILSPHLSPAASALRADNSERTETDIHQEQMQTGDHGLLQQCREQQRRIAELELRLQQAQNELRQHASLSSSAISDRPVLSPAHSTDEDSSDRPHGSSGGETDEDGHRAHDGSVAMTDAADDSSQWSSIGAASSYCPQASGGSIAVRRSERSKTNVDRWRPPTQRDASSRPAEPSSSRKKRKTQRRQRAHHEDREHDISSAMMSMEVESMDDQAAVDGAEDNDTAGVATLVAKLREAYDRRPSVALDSLSKESIFSLRKHVLEEAGVRLPSISGQITSLISTSTSLKMMGYYLRAILAHRLKHSSQNCYKRLAGDTLGIKSPADIAAYPALYELVQYHYPNLASAGIEAWLENPIFSADITWTAWKRYLTKAGQTHHRRRVAAVPRRDGPIPGLDAAGLGRDLRRRQAGRAGRASAARHSNADQQSQTGSARRDGVDLGGGRGPSLRWLRVCARERRLARRARLRLSHPARSAARIQYSASLDRQD
jgi:hypothetical protein